MTKFKLSLFRAEMGIPPEVIDASRESSFEASREMLGNIQNKIIEALESGDTESAERYKNDKIKIENSMTEVITTANNSLSERIKTEQEGASVEAKTKIRAGIIDTVKKSASATGEWLTGLAQEIGKSGAVVLEKLGQATPALANAAREIGKKGIDLTGYAIKNLIIGGAKTSVEIAKIIREMQEDNK